MKLNADNDPAVRHFEDWVRQELYGPDDPRAQRSKEPQSPDHGETVSDRKDPAPTQ